jgi:hypothetical protein
MTMTLRRARAYLAAAERIEQRRLRGLAHALLGMVTGEPENG